MINEKRFTSFDICYAIGKIFKLSLVNYRSENSGWYKFKDNIKNKTLLIKYIKNKESSIQFEDLCSLTNEISKLIIVYQYLEQYKYLEIETIHIKNIQNKKGYFKLKENQAIFYPKKELGQSIPYKLKEIGKIKIVDLKLTISRYEAIMERNYINRLNYLLFEFYSNIQKIQNWSVELKNRSKKKYEESFKNFLNYEEIFKMLIIYPVDIYKEIDSKTKKAYKKLYEDMKEIRKRNMFNDIIQKDKEISEKFNSYQEKYYTNYQSIILTFQDFNTFWNIPEGRLCEYCGVSENEIISLAKKDKIHTKRYYSRGKTMEIDKIDADGEYELTNIVLSCYWCNNAKTDEFTFDEFKLIAEGIKKLWKKRLEELEFLG